MAYQSSEQGISELVGMFCVITSTNELEGLHVVGWIHLTEQQDSPYTINKKLDYITDVVDNINGTATLSCCTLIS